MSAWLGNGVTGSGTPVLAPEEIAVLSRSSLISFVDYDYMDRQIRKGLDANGRLLSFNDRKGNAFAPVISATTAAQFTEWTNGQYGLSAGSNRGAFQSSSALIPTSGSFTFLSLHTQSTLAVAGYAMANSDTASYIAMGWNTDNKMRVFWDGTTIALTSVTNDQNPCMMAISYDAGAGRLRSFHNNVEVDDRVVSAPTLTDYKLMEGALKSATVTAGLAGVKNCALLFSEAGDDGSAFITMLKEFAENRANQGWTIV